MTTFLTAMTRAGLRWQCRLTRRVAVSGKHTVTNPIPTGWQSKQQRHLRLSFHSILLIDDTMSSVALPPPPPRSSLLYGRHFRIVSVNEPPFAIEPSPLNANWTGSILDTIYLIANLAGFTFQVEREPNDTYGDYTFVDGQRKWDGMLGYVQRQEAHIAVSRIAITPARYLDFEFATPTRFSRRSAIMYRSDDYPAMNSHWLTAVQALTMQSWLLLAMSALVIVAVIVLAEYFITGRVRPMRALESVVRMSVNQTTDREDPGVGCTTRRFAAVTWALASVVVLAFYSARVFALLAVKSPWTPPFHSFQTMLDADYRLIVIRHSGIAGHLLRQAEEGAEPEGLALRRLFADPDSQIDNDQSMIVKRLSETRSALVTQVTLYMYI